MVTFTKKSRPSTTLTKKERPDFFTMTWNSSDPKTWADCDFSWQGITTKTRPSVSFTKKARPT